MYPKKSMPYAKILATIYSEKKKDKSLSKVDAEYFLKSKYGDLYEMLFDLSQKMYSQEEIKKLNDHLAAF